MGLSGTRATYFLATGIQMDSDYLLPFAETKGQLKGCFYFLNYSSKSLLVYEIFC